MIFLEVRRIGKVECQPRPLMIVFCSNEEQNSWVSKLSTSDCEYLVLRDLPADIQRARNLLGDWSTVIRRHTLDTKIVPPCELKVWLKARTKNGKLAYQYVTLWNCCPDWAERQNPNILLPTLYDIINTRPEMDYREFCDVWLPERAIAGARAFHRETYGSTTRKSWSTTSGGTASVHLAESERVIRAIFTTPKPGDAIVPDRDYLEINLPRPHHKSEVIVPRKPTSKFVKSEMTGLVSIHDLEETHKVVDCKPRDTNRKNKSEAASGYVPIFCSRANTPQNDVTRLKQVITEKLQAAKFPLDHEFSDGSEFFSRDLDLEPPATQAELEAKWKKNREEDRKKRREYKAMQKERAAAKMLKQDSPDEDALELEQHPGPGTHTTGGHLVLNKGAPGNKAVQTYITMATRSQETATMPLSSDSIDDKDPVDDPVIEDYEQEWLYPDPETFTPEHGEQLTGRYYSNNQGDVLAYVVDYEYRDVSVSEAARRERLGHEYWGRDGTDGKSRKKKTPTQRIVLLRDLIVDNYTEVHRFLDLSIPENQIMVEACLENKRKRSAIAAGRADAELFELDEINSRLRAQKLEDEMEDEFMTGGRDDVAEGQFADLEEMDSWDDND